MTQFMGTHRNRLDAKMRVSVPASFRNVLRLHGTELVMRPSHQYACLEAWPMPVFEGFAKPLQRLDLFGERQSALAVSLYADACSLEPDKEGRVVLPDHLVEHAQLTDSVVFIGLGERFHIWEPAAGLAFISAARERARSEALTLPGTQSAAA
jgi:MraZ protein